MPCTTLLVGKKASWDGSTMMARNEDAFAGNFEAKRMIVVRPEDQPRHYVSVLSKVEIPLEDTPMRYTAVPNADLSKGIWGEAGINACNVAMSATETITSNARVQGADPILKGAGIGEEDMVTIVLPYIHTAREGVLRLGKLLETYGTYEMNGIGFQDADEIWWMETIGGHHWMARRVPDDAYVVMPNQQGIDFFDFVDAMGEKKDHLCSADLPEFVRKYHLDLSPEGGAVEECWDFDARAAFGSREDADHSYNTPRAWTMERYLNPHANLWDGPDADFRPTSDDIPWMRVPEKKITVEDIKRVLSDHYQGTPYDPYAKHGDPSMRGALRPIGINRNNHLALTVLRSDVPEEIMGVMWLAMGSNVFNAMIPLYANVDKVPEYVSFTPKNVSTDSFYWANRLIGALADAHFSACASPIERYQNAVANRGQAMLVKMDQKYMDEHPENVTEYLESCNEEIAQMAREETDDVLSKVLYQASMEMKNGFARSDC